MTSRTPMKTNRKIFLRAAGARGMALPLVLIAVAAAVLIGLTFLRSASTATRPAQQAAHESRARAIAESGLEQALAYMEANPDWREEVSSSDWITQQDFAGGSYSVWLLDGFDADGDGTVDGDGDLTDNLADPVTIEVTAVYNNVATRTNVVWTSTEGSTLAVSDVIELRDDAVIDSYDASQGAYGPSNKSSAAVISSNKTDQKNVILSDRARVAGSLQFPSGSDPAIGVEINDSAVITGGYGTMVSAVDIDPPTVPVLGSSSGDYLHNTGYHTIDSSMVVDDFTLIGDAEVEINSEVSIVVNGDLTLENSAQITLGANAGAYSMALGNELLLDDNADVRGFNSATGVVNSEAVVISNATSSDALTIKSNGIYGDVFTAGSPSSVIDLDGGTIHGTRGVLEEPFSMPSEWSGSISGGSDLDLSSGTRTITEDSKFSELKVSGSGKLRIDGDVDIYVKENFIVDGGDIEILNGSRVNIYANKQVIFENGADVNQNTKMPAQLIIQAKGSYEHIVKGSSDVYAVLLAPRGSLTMDDTAEYYGAFTGDSAQIKGNSTFYTDSNPDILSAVPDLPHSGSNESAVDFDIDGGDVVVNEAYAANIKVLGTGIDSVPVTVMVTIDDQDIEPFGSYTDGIMGNVNGEPEWLSTDTSDYANWVKANRANGYSTTETQAGNTAISITGRSWDKRWFWRAWDYPNNLKARLTVNTVSNPNNVIVLRDGDDIPDIDAVSGQDDIAAFVSDYMNTDTNKIELDQNQAIYLFELYTTDMSSIYADFQDLVLLVELAKTPTALMGESSAGKLTMYVNGSINMEDDSAINSGGEWRNLTIYQLGTSDALFQDRADYLGCLHLANATAQFQDNATFEGEGRFKGLDIRDDAVLTANSSNATLPGVVADQSVNMQDDAILQAVSGVEPLGVNYSGHPLVILKNNAVHNGDVYAAPGGSPIIRIEDAAQVTGTTGVMSDSVQITTPDTPTGILSEGAFTRSSGSETLSDTTRYSSFALSGTGAVTISGDMTLLVDGNFSVADTASITLEDGAKLTVYAGGNISMAGSAAVNTAGEPSAVLWYVQGSTISMSGSAEAVAKVTAPNATLNMSGYAELMGSFLGDSILLQGNAAIHYDTNESTSLRWVMHP